MGLFTSEHFDKDLNFHPTEMDPVTGKVSFGVIGLAVGSTLLSYGFGAYFTILPGSEWSALMLT